MDIQTVVSVLGLLGIGGIAGSYFQHIWGQRRETELRIQTLNENKYRSTLVFMRCVLKPANMIQFDIDDPSIRKLKDEDEIQKYAKNKVTEYYYNSILYASDQVLMGIKQFIDNPSESNFMKAAVAMRKDLWKKGTKTDLASLSLE